MLREDFLRMRLCTGKFRPLSREQASREAERLTRVKKIAPSLSFYAYRCCFCSGFHVGRSDQEDRYSEFVRVL